MRAKAVGHRHEIERNDGEEQAEGQCRQADGAHQDFSRGGHSSLATWPNKKAESSAGTTCDNRAQPHRMKLLPNAHQNSENNDTINKPISWCWRFTLRLLLPAFAHISTNWFQDRRFCPSHASGFGGGQESDFDTLAQGGGDPLQHAQRVALIIRIFQTRDH